MDVVGFASTNSGPVWSFSISPLSAEPTVLAANTVAELNAGPLWLSLTSPSELSWTATVEGDAWMSLRSTNRVTPALLTVSFQTDNLAPGFHTNQVMLSGNGILTHIPVVLEVEPLQIIKMVADQERSYIYALHLPPRPGQSGRILFINSDTERIQSGLAIVTNPRDLSVSYVEGRLYVTDWLTGWLRVVDLQTRTELASIKVPAGADRVNAGRAGRVVLEDAQSYRGPVYLINTASADGQVLSTIDMNLGDGEMSPDGSYYYHCELDGSSTGPMKYDITNDTPYFDWRL